MGRRDGASCGVTPLVRQGSTSSLTPSLTPTPTPNAHTRFPAGRLRRRPPRRGGAHPRGLHLPGLGRAVPVLARGARAAAPRARSRREHGPRGGAGGGVGEEGRAAEDTHRRRGSGAWRPLSSPPLAAQRRAVGAQQTDTVSTLPRAAPRAAPFRGRSTWVWTRAGAWC